MHTIIKSLIIFLCLGISGSLFAIEVKGVNIPDSATVIGPPDQKLVLNGTGIRTKFVFNIYIGALYLPQKTKDAKKVINDPVFKRISMYFLYDEISKKKMTDGWTDGFKDNLDDDTFKKLQPQIKQFNSFFPDIVKGNTVVIDFIPGKGSVVTINDRLQGTVAGEDFQKALLSIWFGKDPPNEALKKGMLNISDD